MAAKEDNPWDWVTPIMDAHGYDVPTQTQQWGIEHGGLEPGNVMLVADTGNGKTLCAEARVRKEVESGNRVAYLVPSKQLKSAKSEELEVWAGFDVRVSGRDNDAYKNGDVVIATFEGYYQMSLRHPAKVSDISLAVLDDFHYLYEPYRGFTIEKLITTLKKNNTSIFAMSASIGGAENLAEWMNANLIVSPEPRKVPINEEVVIRDGNSSIRKQVAAFISDNPSKGPFLVFNKSRSTAESAAKEIAKARGWDPEIDSGSQTRLPVDKLDEPDTEWVALKRIQAELDEMVEAVTPELEKLAHFISRGVAYHHAGLPRQLRDYVEELFMEGLIDTLTLTTTLASGYDAPVQTVIVADYTRWTGDGSSKIGVWEYEQWIGRAGRQGYDHDEGHAAILAKSEEDVQEYLAPRELEEIESHVKEDELLRKFLLELIVTGHKTEDEIRKFLHRTLWMHDSVDDVFGVEYDPMESVQSAIAWLADNKFIERVHDGFRSTALGSATVSYGFRQFGHYSLIGIRNLYEWIEETEEITRIELAHAICKHQEITLYDADEHDVSELFEDNLVDLDLDPNTEYARTAGVISWYWCQNVNLEAAAESSGLRAEFTNSVARQIHDVLEFLPELAEVAGDTELPGWFEIFKLRVKYGVTEEQAMFVNLVDGVGRVKVRELDHWLDDHNRDLAGGGAMARLADLIDQTSADLVREQIKDRSAGVPGFGKELSKRTIDAVTDHSS